MMGSVLVQPQRVRRSREADPAVLLISEIANLATRLATDSQQGGRIATLISEAAEQSVREFLEARSTAAQSAGPRMTDWFFRVLRALTGVTTEFSARTPAEGIELVRTVLERIGANLESGTGARIRPYVAELLDIIQNELGLSLPAIENMVWDVVDDIVARLEAEPLEINRFARENRLDTIRILRRIKRLIRGKFPLPVVDADRVTDAIVTQLRRVKVDAVAQKINCISNGVGALSTAASAIEDLVPLSVSAFSSLGAAAAATPQNEQYLWYPSWLYDKPVVLNAERTEIRKGDEVIASGSNLTIADIPDFKSETIPHYTFPRFQLDTMESTAFVAYVCADALNAILHATSIEEGDISSNAGNTLWNLFLTGSKITERRPVFGEGWDSYGVPMIMSFALGWEGIHTRVNCKNFMAMWLTLFGPDVLETLIYRVASTMVRDALLSGMTLINYTGDFQAPTPDNRPLNRKHVKGVISLPGILIDKAVFASFPREEYGQPGSHPDGGVKFIVFWGLLVSTLFAVFNKFAGYFLAVGLGRTIDTGVLWDSFKAKFPFTDKNVPLLAIPPAWILWYISLYMAVEGDTDDGKFNPSGLPFDGYAPHDQSPYTLPYRDTAPAVYVGQANQGVFSHHFLNIEQTYSYDFSMDEDAIILASRSGTVVDYFDWVENDIDPDATQIAAATAAAVASGFLVVGQTRVDSWNFIAIRHDRDDTGALLAAPDATHDKGPGGVPVTTYGVYGHGRKDSVRELFGARGILPGAIIGSTVLRGQRIMRAGDTGISFHNHLHQMVQSGPATGSPVSRFNLNTGTIPYVFKDVTHLFSRDGVCKNLNFYSSETPDLG